MKGEFILFFRLLFIFILFTCISRLSAQDLSLNVNADLVSRYIWRGLNVNDQPNIQPSIALEYYGFQLGLWGSYGIAFQNSSDEEYSASQEIDTWLGYSFELTKGININAVATDYYYPGSGLKIGNFNNYNDENGPGTHTVEAGLIISGSDSFPLALSGYINVYNDKGNNIYLQADYSTIVAGTAVVFFIGAAAGSKDNPDYYNTNKFNVINIGLKATKQIKISEDFSLPVYCSYILNPREEISYLVFGLSL